MNITIDGLRLAYSDRGPASAIPVLFIHGFPFNRSIWEPQMRGLTPEFRCIAPDLRGFGQSQATAAASMDTYARDCLALLDRLDIDQAVVAGLSMGGYIAMAMWRLAPERLRGLALVDTRAEADSAEGKAGRDAAIAKLPEQGVEGFAAGMLPKLVASHNLDNRGLTSRLMAIMSSASLPGCMAALAAMRDRPDSTETLRGVSVPTLIVVGEQDVLTPVAAAEAMHAKAPDSELVYVPRAAHVANLEAARIVNGALRRFLRSLAAHD